MQTYKQQYWNGRKGQGGGGKGSIENKGSCGVTSFITTV